MSLSQIPAIENKLVAMRQVTQQLALPTLVDSRSDPAKNGFATELVRSLDRVSALQNKSAAQWRAFELGVPDVTLNDIMIDMQTAGLAFNATVQVRNRLVAAYQEIASMPV